jgi:predicted Zn-dependent peptidase
MKTAMTQFLEWLENSSNVQNDILDWETVKENAFEKEKEQIIEAINEWCSNDNILTPEQYYNNTYNNENL